MGAEGTGVAKEAAGPMVIGIELVVVDKISELELASEVPEAITDRFSKISNGEDWD